jgi:hypothetical protein
MITQKMFFQINDGIPKEFGEVINNEPFIIEFSRFPSKEEIEGMEQEQANTRWSLLQFKDGSGNIFRVFNKPV